MRGDLRITFWRGMYVSCIIQRIFILSGLQADIFITEKTFSLLKSMEKAPEGPERVLPKFLKLKPFYYMPHSCEVAFRKPVGRYSPFCQTATLFPLAKVDVSWRWFSELPGKQTSLADKYRWLTDLHFFLCMTGFPSCSRSFTCLTGTNFLRLQKEGCNLLRKCFRKLLRC